MKSSRDVLESTRVEYILLLLFILAGAGMSSSLYFRNPNIGSDGLQYFSVVFNFFSGNGYLNIPGAKILVEPGYGLLTYLLNLFIGDVEYAGSLVSVMAYILLIPFVYFTIRYIAGRWAALYSTFLVTFFPYLLDYSYVTMTESCFTLFVFIGFNALVKVIACYQDSSMRSNILLGVLLSWIILIRPEGWIYTALALVILFAVSLYHFVQWKLDFRIFYKLLVLLAVIGLALLPWLLFLHQISGMWVISPKQVRIDSGQPTEEAPGLFESSQQEEGEETEETESPTFRPMLYFDRIDELLLPFLRMQVGMHSSVLVPFVIAGGGLILMFFIDKRTRSTDWLKIKQPKSLLLLLLVVFTLPAFAFLARKIYPRYLLPSSIYSLVLLGSLTAIAVEALATRYKMVRYQYLGMIAVMLCSSILLFVPLVERAAGWFDIPSKTIPSSLAARQNWWGTHGAGIWIMDNFDSSTDYTIAMNTRCNVMFFYANGKQFPIDGNCVKVSTLTTWEELTDFFDSGGDFIIFNHNRDPEHVLFTSLWENPEAAKEFGLDISKVAAKGFQIYYQSDLLK